MQYSRACNCYLFYIKSHHCLSTKVDEPGLIQRKSHHFFKGQFIFVFVYFQPLLLIIFLARYLYHPPLYYYSALILITYDSAIATFCILSFSFCFICALSIECICAFRFSLLKMLFVYHDKDWSTMFTAVTQFLRCSRLFYVLTHWYQYNVILCDCHTSGRLG